MGLEAIQAVLARLVTDTALRAEFLADPVATGRRLGLDESETEQVAGLDAERVAAYAESLLRKASADLAKAMPLTRKALGLRYGELTRLFAERHGPKCRPGDGASAEAFAAFLRSVATTPAWLVDLARFEAAARVASDPKRRVVLRRLRYPIGAVASRLNEGTNVAGLGRRPMLAFWFRWRAGGRLRFGTVRSL